MKETQYLAFLDQVDPSIMNVTRMPPRCGSGEAETVVPVPLRSLKSRIGRCRALYCHGPICRMNPGGPWRGFREAIAGGELIRLPAAGHMVIAEQPERVVEALTRLD